MAKSAPTPQAKLPIATAKRTRKSRYNDEGPARTVGGRVTYAGIDKWEDLHLRTVFYGGEGK